MGVGLFKKDLIYSLLLKILGLIMGFMISIIMARVLGIKSFGDYSLAFTWINIIVLIAIAGNTENLLRLAPRKTKPFMMALSSVIAKQSIVIYSVIGLAFFYLAILSSFDSYNSASFKISFFIAFFYGMINIPNRIAQSSIAGNYLNYQVSRINLVYTPLLKFAFIIIIYMATKNKYAVIASIFLTELVVYSIYRSTYKKLYYGNVKQVVKTKLPIVNVYFMIISISYLMLSITDRIMLSFWLPVDDIGGYTAATRISNTVMVFCVGFLPFLPKISELYHNNKIEKLEDSYLIITKLISVFTFPLVIYLALYSDHLLNLFGDKFHMYGPVVVILSFGKMFDAITGPAGSLLSMTKHEKYDMGLILVMSVINIILNFILIPEYGVIGAAISTFISTISVQLIILYTAGKVMSINTYTLKHFILFLIFVFMLFINYNIKEIYHPNIINSLFIMGLNYAIILFVCLRFKIIHINSIKNMLRS